MRQEAPVLDSQTVVGVQARRHDGHDRRLLLALALLTSQGCTSGIEARDSLQGRVEALEAGLEALEVAGHHDPSVGEGGHGGDGVEAIPSEAGQDLLLRRDRRCELRRRRPG